MEQTVQELGDPPRVRHRVLIVDDDEEIRATLRLLFEGEGYDVLEAPDGLAALRILRAVPYPLVVLSNHNMPRPDGPGLFSFVTEDPDLAQRHAYVYMTAGNRVIPPPLVRQLEALSVPVLRKPFDIDDLIAVVEDASRRLEARDTAPGH
jgi:CheY-like chemotaxis protein